LVWAATDLGEGVASVAVAGQRVFTLGKIGDDEQLTALDEATGKKLWSAPVGPAVRGESSLMRWLSPRTPTVDGERVYAVTARADLACFRTADGTLLWRKNYLKDFRGRSGNFGCGDRPLVDGDRLICVTGGKDGVVALDKRTGDVIWRCSAPGDSTAAHSAITMTEVGGIRLYVAALTHAHVGIAAQDGRLLWSYTKLANGIGTNFTPLVSGNHVLCATGYGKGIALLKLTAAGDDVRAEEVWYNKMQLAAWYDGLMLVGEHVYVGAGRDVQCLELATGKEVWKETGAVGGAVSMALAEDNLYMMSQKGEAALVAASPEGYRLKGKMQVPEVVTKPGATAPVIAAGRLYLRDEGRVFCYDLRQGADKPAKPAGPVPSESKKPEGSAVRDRPRLPDEPDAVYVPTPQDVVEKMLELAGVRRNEVVCDLGCGDGRVVVTAARLHGCTAVGYDIDPDCVRLARAHAERQDVGRLVTIDRRDIFTVDLGAMDVVTLYLSPELNERLLPQLAALKPGSRIVSHAFAIPGVPADRVVTVPSTEDHVDHEIYVWTTPLKKERGEK
jgi:outer membrane protein assembly factor BamB